MRTEGLEAAVVARLVRRDSGPFLRQDGSSLWLDYAALVEGLQAPAGSEQRVAAEQAATSLYRAAHGILRRDGLRNLALQRRELLDLLYEREAISISAKGAAKARPGTPVRAGDLTSPCPAQAA